MPKGTKSSRDKYLKSQNYQMKNKVKMEVNPRDKIPKGQISKGQISQGTNFSRDKTQRIKFPMKKMPKGQNAHEQSVQRAICSID